MKGDIHDTEWVWQEDKRTGKIFLRKMEKQRYRIRFIHILIILVFLVGPILCRSLYELWWL